MKTTILLIASWVVLAAYGQNIIRSFADSGCTDLVGFAVSDDVNIAFMFAINLLIYL